MKFEHIGIKVKDMDKSIDFYTKVLKCTIAKETNKNETVLVFLDAHGATLELIYNPKNEQRETGPIDHIAFRVNDLDKKIEELNSYGIELDSPPRSMGNGRIAFFRGPDGERIEYMQYNLS